MSDYALDALALFDKPPARGVAPIRRARRRRLSLRPTWIAVAMSGIVGTVSGVLIAVLSGPVVG